MTARTHLCSAVDDVNLVQADDMHYLLPLLQLPLWALHKLGGWACEQAAGHGTTFDRFSAGSAANN